MADIDENVVNTDPDAPDIAAETVSAADQAVSAAEDAVSVADKAVSSAEAAAETASDTEAQAAPKPAAPRKRTRRTQAVKVQEDMKEITSEGQDAGEPAEKEPSGSTGRSSGTGKTSGSTRKSSGSTGKTSGSTRKSSGGNRKSSGSTGRSASGASGKAAKASEAAAEAIPDEAVAAAAGTVAAAGAVAAAAEDAPAKKTARKTAKNGTRSRSAAAKTRAKSSDEQKEASDPVVDRYTSARDAFDDGLSEAGETASDPGDRLSGSRDMASGFDDGFSGTGEDVSDHDDRSSGIGDVYDAEDGDYEQLYDEQLSDDPLPDEEDAPRKAARKKSTVSRSAKAADKVHTSIKEWVPGPNLPNQLTIARVCMIPLFVILLLWVPKPAGNILAMIVFILASLTDAADGYIARRYNYVSTFGKFMDPLADKLLVCSALICLVDLGRIESWIVIIIIAREFIISGFRLIAVEKGVVIAANYWGKFKTVFQMLMVILMVASFGGFFNVLAQIFKWIALVLTVVSLVTYLWENRQVLQDVR